MKELDKSKFHKGDVLRTPSGFEFTVDKFFRFSIFTTVWCSGYGTNGSIGLMVIEEDKCVKS